ncbi:MAG TPA: WhiB family transcriptional regulator [Nocardia sp.]|uniref:WhiB family transcriptional regulator n=1 Tax=Nocardia sp. TaxID=1821 RepID=UPI002B4B42F5|nr:WhiB family transcriptional regulator [Nocardia sp.]HLS76650.1 WhiB family transcriptional regulator [Nocardia sp.]
MPALRTLGPAVAIGGRHPGKPRGRASLADLGIGPNDQAWQRDAHCRSTDPEAFFPADENPNLLTNRAAYRICADCPVANACLEFATRHKLEGIWGGTNTAYRRRHRRRQHQEEAA